VDFGIGIAENVRRFSRRKVSASSALRWAFTHGSSTKPDIGRGLGLSIIKELVKLNHGRLEVFSNEGHLVIDEKEERYSERGSSFTGTIFTVELRCDRLYYCSL
jgi:signal transduction histidine kinase